MTSKATAKFQALRLKSAKKWPYAATAILALIPVETERVPRMGTDKHFRVYYNPEWLLETDSTHLVTVLLHEFGHAVRKHFKRFSKMVGYSPDQLDCRNVDPLVKQQCLIWNYAADCELNDDLAAEGMSVKDVPGGGGVLPSDFELPNGWTAEQYFQKIWEKVENGDYEQPGDGAESSVSGQPTDGEAGGSGEGSRNITVDWDGSSAVDGFARKWEASAKLEGPDREAHAEDQNGGVPEALSATEIEHLAMEMAKKIDEAVKNRGTVAAGWRRWADQRLRPQVPWQRVLRNVLIRSTQRIHGQQDYTYSRVSRREPARPDLISSSPFARKIKTRVIVDTSGSMTDTDLSLAMGEIDGILSSSELRDGVEVGSCDAAMHTCEKVFKRSQVKLVGGGGTDMTLPIEEVRKEKAATRPDVLLILTDGGTPWPDEPVRGLAVIAVLTEEPSHCAAPPSWIRTIRIK